MRAKTRRTKQFPGDTYIAIDVHLDDGRVIQPFGVWPRRDALIRWYECDSGGEFQTLCQAKAKAIEAVRKMLNQA